MGFLFYLSEMRKMLESKEYLRSLGSFLLSKIPDGSIREDDQPKDNFRRRRTSGLFFYGGAL